MASHAVRRRLLTVLVLASCAGVLAACDEALTGITITPSGGARLVAVTPTQLSATLGDIIEAPIRVRVLDENGRPVQSATVRFNVLVGSGFFSADSTITAELSAVGVAFGLD